MAGCSGLVVVVAINVVTPEGFIVVGPVRVVVSAAILAGPGETGGAVVKVLIVVIEVFIIVNVVDVVFLISFVVRNKI